MRRATLSLGIIFVVSASIADGWVGLRSDLASIPRAEVEQAKEKIIALSRPGDVVVHSPLLGVDELKGLGDIRATSMLPAKTSFETRRILLVDRADVPMSGFPAVSQREWAGATLFVSVFDPPAGVDTVLFDLKDSIQPSTMRIETVAGKVLARCDRPRAEGGYLCPGQDSWHYAAKRTLRIGREDRSCVWAHPKSNAVIVFTVPAPPPVNGRALELRIAGGYTDDAVSTTPDGSISRIVLLQGGVEKGRLSVANRVGWFSHAAGIVPGQELEIRVTSPRDGRRHLCLDAEVVASASASGASK